MLRTILTRGLSSVQALCSGYSRNPKQSNSCQHQNQENQTSKMRPPARLEPRSDRSSRSTHAGLLEFLYSRKPVDFRWILTGWPSRKRLPSRVPCLAHGEPIGFLGIDQNAGPAVVSNHGRAGCRATRNRPRACRLASAIQTRPTCSTRSKVPSGGGEAATTAPTPDSMQPIARSRSLRSR